MVKSTFCKFICTLIILLWITMQKSSAQNNILWKDSIGVVVNNGTNDSLGNPLTYSSVQKTVADGWSNAGAVSENRLEASTNGFVEYTVSQMGNQYSFGLSTLNSNGNPESINYAFNFLSTDKFNISENGVLKTVYANFSIGDKFRIERSGNAIQYKRYKITTGNWITLSTSTNSTSALLMASVSIYTSGFTFKDLKSSFIKPLKANAGIDMSKCAGDPLSIKIGGTSLGLGGKPPLVFSWSPSAGLSSTTVANPKANPSQTTEYTLRVTDNAGNVSSDKMVLTVKPIPVLTEQFIKVCSGEPVNIKMDGAKTYAWSPANGLNTTTGDNVFAVVENPSIYNVVGTGENGCSTLKPINIDFYPKPKVIASADITICSGDLTTLSASGANTYLWSPSTGLSSTTGSVVVASPYSTTVYTVKGTNIYGCVGYDNVKVTVNPLPTITASADVAINYGDYTTLSASGAYSYVWSPSVGLNTTTGSSVTANPSGTVTYKVVGTNAQGCADTKYIKVTVIVTCSSGSGTARNFVDNSLFDDNGMIINQTRSYSDNLGRPTQTLSRLFSKNNTIVNQTIYDGFGRGAIQTLPAPIDQTFLCYKPNFISNSNGLEYSYSDFDVPNSSANTIGEINNPASIDNSTMGTLGWYYSNNNTDEPYVAASAFPYSRVEFYDDPLGRIKRVAGVGENHKIGSGHEQKMYYMSNSGELYYVFGYKGSAIVGMEDDAANFVANENLQAKKTIAVDVDGKVSVTYQTLSGLTIATCRSGIQDGSCIKQKVSQKMYFYGEKGVSIHLPPSCNNTLKLPLTVDAKNNGVFDASNGGSIQINYTITNLSTNQVLVENTDYTFDRVSRQIIFINSAYQNKHLFLRVSYDFIYNNITFNTSILPDLTVEYQLDYDNWSLYYYNKLGQIVKTVAPNSIYCGYDPLASNSVTNSIRLFTIPPTGSQLLETTSITNNTGMDQNLFYTVGLAYNLTGNGGSGGNGTYSSTQRLSSASSSGDDLDNSGITQVVEHGPTSEKDIIQLPDEYHVVHSGIDLYFELKGTNINGNSSIGTGTEHLVLTYWMSDNYPAAPPILIGMGPNPGFEAHFNLPNSTLVQYQQLQLYLTNIKVEDPYNPSSPEQNSVIVDAVIQTLVSDYQISVIKKLNSYPTPIPYNTNLVTKTSYNKLNWPIKSSSPDEGTVNFIYDTEGKVRFQQNAKQLADGGKFSYFVYDRAGRVVETGEFNPSINTSSANLFFEPYTSSGDIPNPLSTNSVHNIIDFTPIDWLVYSSRATQQTYFAYDKAQSDFPTTLNGYDQHFKDGQLAKSNNDKETSWYGYDDRGRLIWVVRSLKDVGIKTIDYSYTADGQLAKMEYQKNNGNERFIHNYSYDADRRLNKTETSFDNINFTTNQALSYYLHGALKRNELGGTLQGLDYVYTINGWLKSVNDPTLTNRDPGQDSYTGTNSTFKKDVFGFTLDYFTNDYSRLNTNIETYSSSSGQLSLPENYSGNIRATRWQTTLPDGASSAYTGMLQYTYKYDNQNQLSQAVFGTAAAGTINGTTATGVSPTLIVEPDAYRVNNISYDKSGNIKTLKRQGTANNIPMDDFTYNYNTTLPNRLTSITNATTSTYNDDIKNQATNNYQYNQIGQLIKDAAADYNYTYNVYGNVTQIAKTSGLNLISIEYNEAGLRQSKTSYSTTGIAKSICYYVYDAGGVLLSTYTKDLSTTTNPIIQADLQVYGAGRVGVYDKSANNYIYELSDHLGNVRATVMRNIAGNAEVLSYADYYPHGSTLPGRNYVSSTAYRFAYQGQEKDNETGFLNFELRQYDARIGRWFNPDPMGQYHSPYLAMGNNPISSIDPTGGNDSWIDSSFPSAKDMWFYRSTHADDFAPNSDAYDYKTNAELNYAEDIKKYNSEMDKINQEMNKSQPSIDGKKSPKNPQKPERVNTSITDGEGKRKYGGDGSGSLFDNTMYVMDQINKFNPFANGWDAITGYIYGKDRFGNPMNFTDKTFAVIGAIPFVNFETGIAKEGEKELFKFSAAAAEHMANPARAVPIQILEQAIKNSKGVVDPRGSRGLMHYSEMWKNGEVYTLEVLYDETTNAIWHFKYSR